MENLKTYTVKELVPILKVTSNTILEYIHSKKLNARKLGKSWIVTEKDLISFIGGK